MAILCCVCGVQIEPNALNMCTSCMAAEVDISEGIALESELTQCSGCLRFLSRGKGVHSSATGAWLEVDWESSELMALCLKNVHGLAKAKLLDANFIWTEPHSKRIKVKLTLQREVVNHAMVQSTCVVSFTIKTIQCPDCMKHYHNNSWRSLIQLRQKTDHKRTFLRLEQLILKHHAHENAIGISSVKDGMDFYFGTKGTADKFMQFLSAHVPMRFKVAHKTISENARQGTANVQTVYSVEMSPICKDDLLLLPKKVAQHCSNISRVAICARTTAMMHLVDPRTGAKGELMTDKYWKDAFRPMETSPGMVEFIVLDVEPVEATNHHHDSGSATATSRGQQHPVVVADIEVARASDFGVNDTTFMVRSHLGAELEAGDTVKGYDLSTAAFSHHEMFHLNEELPDVVLVRKVIVRDEQERQRRAARKKLKKLNVHSSGGGSSKVSKAEAQRQEEEFDAFAEEYLDEQEDSDAEDRGEEEEEETGGEHDGEQTEATATATATQIEALSITS